MRFFYFYFISPVGRRCDNSTNRELKKNEIYYKNVHKPFLAFQELKYQYSHNFLLSLFITLYINCILSSLFFLWYYLNIDCAYTFCTFLKKTVLLTVVKQTNFRREIEMDIRIYG